MCAMCKHDCTEATGSDVNRTRTYVKNKYTKYVAQRTKKKDRTGNTGKCGKFYISSGTDI
jgi:hypothetical protein